MSKYYLFRIIIGALITVFIVLDFHFMNNPDPLKSFDKIRDYVHDIPLQLDFNEDSGYEFINSKAYTFVGVDIRQLDSLIWWKEMELKWQRKDLDYLEFTQFNDDSTLQTNYTIAFCNSQNNKLLSEFLGKEVLATILNYPTIPHNLRSHHLTGKRNIILRLQKGEYQNFLKLSGI